MSTLRINNIEAQSIPASPTIDEKVKVTNSSGDILVNIDGKTSGITTIGINTTDGNIKFDANSNVLITGILTATTLAGNFTPDSLEVGSSIKLGNAGVITATSFVGSGANLTGISAGTALSGSTNNTVCTVTGANAIQGEANLTYDGTSLKIGGDSGVSGTWHLETYNGSGDGTAIIAGTTGAKIELRDTGSSEQFVLAANGDCNVYSYLNGDNINFHTTDGSGTAERLRITSSGHLKMPDTKEIQLGNDDQTATGDLRIFHNGSNSGIINSQGALYIQNTATNSSDLHLQGKSSIQFHCPADGTTPLRITSSGRVGINEASPIALLHIDSDDTTPPVTIDTATNNRGIIVRNPNGGDGSIWAYGNSNTMDWSFTTYSTNPLLYLKNNGNVGIQTNDPDYVLDLGGTALNQDDGTEYTLRIRSNNNKTAIRVGSGGGGSRVGLMRFDGDSNPGNGVGCSGQTDAGAYGGTLVYHGDRSGNENSFAVYMDQGANASQIEAFNIRQNGDYMHGGSSYSDQDQKENITAISGTALDKITQLSPKTWNWKPEYHDIPTDRIFAGFIAQEVQPHIPSIVTGTDGQGDMALDYQGLLAWTIKAVTELNTKVETLEAEVAALKSS